jgi:translation initiation factor 2 subunit 3
MSKDILPFYSKEANLALNQEVICYPTRVEKTQGVYVYLPEFGDIEGFIPMSEISDRKRERRNPQKVVKIGKIFVARVYNTEGNNLTLTRRRLRKEDIEACEKRFKDALTMLKIVENMAQSSEMTTQDCHALIMWPLYELTEDPMDFVQNAIVKPEQLDELPITTAHHALLVEVVIQTIGKASAVASRQFEVTVDHDRGMHVIQYAMSVAETLPPPQNVGGVSITYQGSHYLLSCKCAHPSMAEAYLQQVEKTFMQCLASPKISSEIYVDMQHEGTHGVEYQPTLNVGLIGHVSHGKSSICRAISGVKTQRHKKEKETNCTIKLGYTNAKIYSSDDGSISSGSSKSCAKPGQELVQHISFVDCPGHDAFMTTMLGGSSLMDAALLVVAANDGPQAQTAEHLMVMDITKMKHIAVLHNKTELIAPDKIQGSVASLREYIQGTVAKNAPIFPVSANLEQNIDAVCKFIASVPPKENQLEKAFLFATVRSFDVNIPGTVGANLRGAVFGGSIMQGKVQVGNKVEIRPGRAEWTQSGTWEVTPYQTTVLSLRSDTHNLGMAIPGGCVAIQTTLDPGLSRGDGFVGQLIGHSDDMPTVYHELDMEVYLMRKTVSHSSDSKVKLRKEETIVLQIQTYSVPATVLKVRKTSDKKKKVIRFRLSKPACANLGQVVAISRSDRRLIGYGKIARGTETKVNLTKTNDLVTLKRGDGMLVEKKPKDEVLLPVNKSIVLPENDALEKELVERFQQYMTKKEKSSKLVLPPPCLIKDGGKRFRWTNVYEIMEKLGRPVEDLQKFIVAESGQNANLNTQDKVMILHGAFQKKHVNKLLVGFAKRKIMCSQCSSLQTSVQNIKGFDYLVCKECKAERCV